MRKISSKTSRCRLSCWFRMWNYWSELSKNGNGKSFGYTIRGAHSPDERANIPSAQNSEIFTRNLEKYSCKELNIK